MAKLVKGEADQRDVDRTSEDSFPASDPPSWTMGQDAAATTSASAPTATSASTTPAGSLPGALPTPSPRAAVATATAHYRPEPSARGEDDKRADGRDLGRPLLLVGGAAMAAAVALLFLGRSRPGHALGQIAGALLAVGLYRELDQATARAGS